jgi:hypothetical protein
VTDTDLDRLMRHIRAAAQDRDLPNLERLVAIYASVYAADQIRGAIEDLRERAEELER